MTSLRLLMTAMLMVLLSQQPVVAAEKLTIAVASNAKFVFDDLAHAFTQDTGISIDRIFSSSGKIVAQVQSGAPYDIFLSADLSYPQRLYAKGLTTTPPRVYAYGKLVIWTKSPQFDLGQGVNVLLDSKVERLAIANPKLAPYGVQALHALQQLGLKEAMTGKLVYTENIAQVVHYVDSGNADAGITAKSLVMRESLRTKGHWIELPQQSYEPIAQGAVILKQGATHHARASRLFYDFLYSPKAREILARFGYGLP